MQGTTRAALPCTRLGPAAQARVWAGRVEQPSRTGGQSPAASKRRQSAPVAWARTHGPARVRGRRKPSGAHPSSSEKASGRGAAAAAAAAARRSSATNGSKCERWDTTGQRRRAKPRLSAPVCNPMAPRDSRHRRGNALDGAGREEADLPVSEQGLHEPWSSQRRPRTVCHEPGPVAKIAVSTQVGW